MNSPEKNKIRNIGIMAHIDAGKTTVSERILFYTGLSRKMGEVHEGTAVMDWMEQEQKRGITITSAATACFWKDIYINLIDTPGHVDFTIEVERSLRVLDGAVAVFDSAHGVEPQSETVWRQADTYKVPRICFLNKMDRLGASFEKSFASIEQKLSLSPLAIQWPVYLEGEFKGLLDLVNQKMILWDKDELGQEFSVYEIPKNHQALFKQQRELLIEKLTKEDEHLLEEYLKDENLSADLIKQSLRQLTLDLKITPVLCGSAFKNKGIQALLEAIKDYLPSPLDTPRTSLELCPAKDEHALSALAFKIAFDSFSGSLTYIRVYSGVLKKGQALYNIRQKKTERVQKILKMHSNTRKELQEIKAGDIAVIAGLKWSQTGDSLCSKENPIVLERLTFPEPALSVAIEPKSSGDQSKIEEALKKLKREDPSCQTKKDEDTGQILLMGMGELHIEILLDRLQKEYKVLARVGKPQVSFRETSSIKAEGVCDFQQEIQGLKRCVKIALEISPFKSPKGFVFEAGDFSNPEVLSALEEGLNQGRSSGPLAGYPIRDIKVHLLSLEYKEEDLNLLAIESCAYQAFNLASKKAIKELLEPVFRVVVTSPVEFIGAISGDIKARRGQIEDINKQGELKVIVALVPLIELFGYATILRSLSQGRGSFSMEIEGYKLLPEKEKQKILGP